MFGIATWVLAFFFIFTVPVLAEDSGAELPSLGVFKTAHWQNVNVQMAPRKYGKAVRHNKRIIQRAARNYVEGGLVTMGISKQAVAITGATVGFFVKGGHLNLNESKTLALEVSEVIESDRALLLRYKLGW
ncbi:MAG: hypothetical protein GY807_08040 [Gammaproteobacteria bacterium]|nr:hypothetical protein [Gammaproteobacteria bacterium]